jgi:hypothetical protein
VGGLKGRVAAIAERRIVAGSHFGEFRQGFSVQPRHLDSASTIASVSIAISSSVSRSSSRSSSGKWSDMHRSSR